IPFKREEKYVGVVLNSTLHNIFANHYKKKATAAQSSAHAGLFGLEHHIGRGNIPIRTSLQLYTALVDCHLIHGADVCPDLEAVQASTLRRILASAPSWASFQPQDDGPPKQITACLRHYLNQVTIPDHRFAMTRILLGANNLHGVHSETSTAPIALRQCRMCHCVADDETIVIRNEFKQRLADITHRRFSPAVFTDGAALFWLRSVLFDWNAAPVVARWIYHTTRRWKALSLLPCEVLSAEISWNSERDDEREHI
ncbi:hypothetical protein BDZ89DRAFT_1086964, partial [Hymenopellis radicata]